MKAFKLSALIIFILGIGLYLGLWVYSAQWFEREIDKIYAQEPRDDFQFLGQKPTLDNFPFVPEVNYHGGIQTGEAKILFPQMILRGYPIPGLTLRATFPLGIMLDGIADPTVWKLDYFETGVAVPYKIPGKLNRESLQAWKKHGGKIDVRDYMVRKESLKAEGVGLLTVDNNLQPVFNLESKITGHDAFIESQLQAGLIEPFPAAIARGVFGSLARPDEKTGENTVNINVSVENRMLRVGPVTVLELPLIVWDTHTPPDLRL